MLAVSICLPMTVLATGTDTGTGTGTGTSSGTSGGHDSTGDGTNQDIGEGSGQSSDGMTAVSDGITIDPVTNDITYTSNDHQHKPGQTYYHTVGFDVADATVVTNADGSPKTNKEGDPILKETGNGSIKIWLPDDTDLTNSLCHNNGTWNPDTAGLVTTTSWTINYTELLNLIAVQNPAWYERLTEGKTTVALKLDSIFQVMKNKKEIDDNGGNYYDKNSYSAMCKKYGFRLGYIMTHANKGTIKNYVTPNPDDTSDPTEDADAQIAINREYKNPDGSDRVIGKEAADVYTYNYNPDGQFDLGDSIPTSEKVRNGYQADAWFGQSLIGKHTATKTWYFTGNITYDETEVVKDADGKDVLDAKGNKITYTNTVSKPNYYKVTREVSYWYLAYTAFYDLDTIKTTNEVFPEKTHNYTSNITVPMSATQSGKDLTQSGASSTGDRPDDTYHIDWDNAFPSKNSNVSTSGSSKSEAIAAFDKEAESRIDAAGDILVRNDSLKIDGHTYMDGTTHKYSESKDSEKAGDKYAYNEIGENDYGFDEEKQDTSMTGENEVISPNVKNGTYGTDIEAVYKSIITPSESSATQQKGASYNTSESGKGKAGYILSGVTPTKLSLSYASQEPVKVHTPVVSPVKIEGSESTTQLVTKAKNDDVDYQLLLDGTYTIKFDPEVHFEHIGYVEAANNTGLSSGMYNKYTKRKYVCFPFTVQVDGKIYEPSDKTKAATDDCPAKEAGYTDWIKLYSDDADGHDTDSSEDKNANTTKIYIPTWAAEGSDYTVKYMVVPENATKEDFDREQGNEDYGLNIEKGTNGNYKYMALYTMEVQLSGRVYDFQAVGIQDKFNYITAKEKENTDMSNEDYPFCPTLSEKKQGTLNRLGGNTLRYTFNGKTTTNWSAKNILPFSTGTGGLCKLDGELAESTQFAFSVRTIANLWNEDGSDEMYIIPTYRWVSYDGKTTKDNVNVYYTKYTDTGKYEYCKYGSEQDTSMFAKLSLGDEKLKGSFYEDNPRFNSDRAYDPKNPNWWQQNDLLFSYETANKWLMSTYGKNTHYCGVDAYLNKTQPCSTLSKIRMTQDLRILSGNTEQLAQNLDKQESSLTYVKSKDENYQRYPLLENSRWYTALFYL